MGANQDTFEIVCPQCGGRATAAAEQRGQTMGCPHCRRPLQLPPPPPRSSGPTPPRDPNAPPPGRPFHFRCLRCASVLEGRSNQSGQQGKCPTCGGVFTVPPMDPRTGLAVSHADPGDDGENPTPMHAYAAAGTKAPGLVRKQDESVAILCSRCQRESDVRSNNCPFCGLPFTMEGLTFSVPTRNAGGGTAALTLGILAVPMAFCIGIGFIPGILAVGIGLVARSKARGEPTGTADAGILLGVLACAISLLVLTQTF